MKYRLTFKCYSTLTGMIEERIKKHPSHIFVTDIYDERIDTAITRITLFVGDLVLPTASMEVAAFILYLASLDYLHSFTIDHVSKE